MKNKVTILGVSFVKPSDNFMLYAQTISKIPAKIRKTQAMTSSKFKLESGRPDDFSQIEGGRSS